MPAGRLSHTGCGTFGAATIPSDQVASTTASTRRFVTQPIGAARPGEWILAKNPQGAEDEDLEITDSSAWRLVKLSIADSFGWQVEIETLQRAAWLAELDATVDSIIEVELLELDAEGDATIVSIDPCPKIKARPSLDHHLIVSKFRRRAANVVQLHVDGGTKPIGVTANHPFWSHDRQEFIEAGQLRAGESVTDPDGKPIRIAQIDLTARTAEVFNIEVAGEHVYHVGNSGIIAHNDCFSTATKKFWKNELVNNGHKYSAANKQLLAAGKGPRMKVEVSVRDKKTGKRYTETRTVTMELHHRTLPQRLKTPKANGLWNLEPAAPWAHAGMDSHRHTGYELIKIIKSIKNF